MQEENLALPLEFAIDRVPNNAFVIAADNRLDRKPIERRRLNRGHIFYSNEGQVERARNRCGRKR